MVVGLTGGIGSGKTFVSSLFQELGVPVYISDIEAKKLMHTQADVMKAIVKLFGKNAYEQGVLNRKFIASQVFVDKDKLEKLNAIVHPAVSHHFKNWYKEQKSDFVIKESAILFETKGNEYCDAVILVIAPEEVRISRVLERDKTTANEIRNRMNNQKADDEKIPLSDYIISNIDREETKNKVKEIYQLLSEQATSC